MARELAHAFPAPYTSSLRLNKNLLSMGFAPVARNENRSAHLCDNLVCVGETDACTLVAVPQAGTFWPVRLARTGSVEIYGDWQNVILPQRSERGPCGDFLSLRITSYVQTQVLFTELCRTFPKAPREASRGGTNNRSASRCLLWVMRGLSEAKRGRFEGNSEGISRTSPSRCALKKSDIRDGCQAIFGQLQIGTRCGTAKDLPGFHAGEVSEQHQKKRLQRWQVALAESRRWRQ